MTYIHVLNLNCRFIILLNSIIASSNYFVTCAIFSIWYFADVIVHYRLLPHRRQPNPLNIRRAVITTEPVVPTQQSTEFAFPSA